MQETIRTHGRPLAGIAGKPTTLSSTTTSGATSVENLGEPLVDVTRPVDERLPGREDELAELLEGALAEDGRRVADEVLPELARLLGLRGRGREPHRPLLEPFRLERAGERLLDDEDDPVAAPAQHVADAHAVVRGTERALGEEDDRPAGGAQRPNGLKGFGLVEKSTPFVSR